MLEVNLWRAPNRSDLGTLFESDSVLECVEFAQSYISRLDYRGWARAGSEESLVWRCGEWWITIDEKKPKTEFQKFARIEAEVEAVQWDGTADTANAFVGERYGTDWVYLSRGSENITILSNRQELDCFVGDWILKANGKVWVVEEEDFFKLYRSKVPK